MEPEPQPHWYTDAVVGLLRGIREVAYCSPQMGHAEWSARLNGLCHVLSDALQDAGAPDWWTWVFTLDWCPAVRAALDELFRLQFGHGGEAVEIQDR